ncbi:MAG: AtpZ/AtpI family protein [Chloroflexi bacterium]|nr:AtpZ/AtpI family protein [Chloroflexota bacterium]
MQRRGLSQDAHRAALQAVLGEPGVSGVFLVLIAAGAGMLLDFLVVNLHPVFSVGLLLLSIPASQYWTIRKVLRMTQKSNPDYVRNLALASVAGQSGCMTVILIFMALFAGMFLDARLNTHPLFTIGLVLVSVPVSLYMMIRLLLSSVAAIKHPAQNSDAGAGDAAGSLHKEKRS